MHIIVTCLLWKCEHFSHCMCVCAGLYCSQNDGPEDSHVSHVRKNWSAISVQRPSLAGGSLAGCHPADHKVMGSFPS